MDRILPESGQARIPPLQFLTAISSPTRTTRINRAGILSDDNPPPELGSVLLGRNRGRAGPEEITVFDSTGTGLQDVVAADVIYQRALQAGWGMWVAL